MRMPLIQPRFAAQPKPTKTLQTTPADPTPSQKPEAKVHARFFPPEIPAGLESPTKPKADKSLKMLFQRTKKDAQANSELVNLFQSLKELHESGKIRVFDLEPFARRSEQRYAPLIEIDGQPYYLTQGMRTKTGGGWVQNSAYFTLKRTDGRIELDYTYGQEAYYRDNELGIKLKGNSKELVQLGAAFQNILSRLLSDHSQGQYSREVQSFEQDIQDAKLLDY